MFTEHEAVDILGLTRSESLDESVIIRKWKSKVAAVHPDKTRSDTTAQTQQLNQAKDILLDRLRDPFEKQRQAAEEERVAQMKADIAQWQEEARHAHERRKKKTRRIHRKIGDYQMGAALVKEIREFFCSEFEVSMQNRLMVNEILQLFIQSKTASTELESNLFRRHSKRLFLEAWPNAIYSIYKNKRCFLHVMAKKNPAQGR